MQLPFLKKDSSATGKGMIPVERVKELSSKGFSELEMIDVLRKEGYSPAELDRAMTQALKTEITTPPQYAQEESKLPTLEDIIQKPEMPQTPETSLPQEYYSEGYSPEEYINYAVEAKMNESNRTIYEISAKINELEKRIGYTHEQVNALMQTKSSEQTQILEKLESFKEAISDMDIRLGGMEKAFKEALPPLIESVRALCDLVQRFKKEV
jgi:chromosome segregation ATPase